MFLLQWKCNKEIKNLGFYKSADDAFGAISFWWKMKHFKPNYVRILGDKNNIQAIDFGSCSQFLYIIPLTEDNFEELTTTGIKAEGMYLDWEEYTI